MTKQEAIAKHRKMWNWIADETERRKIAVGKEMYFDAMNISGKDLPLHNCYCCEYDSNNGEYDCNSCPIEWPGGSCSAGGLYSQWLDTFNYYSWYFDWITATSIARQIAELPEKEDVKSETD